MTARLALLYLAAAGVGKITIIDPGRVDVSNLQRQILYTEADAGALKAEAAEAIKVLTGIGEPLSGRLLLWDALTMQVRTVALVADPSSRDIRI